MVTSQQVLDEWYQKVKTFQIAHFLSAEYYGKRKYWLGIPAILLSTAAGTIIFASLQQKTEIWLQITVGLCSVITAILTSLQTFLSYSERAEQHRNASVKYGALSRELEMLRSLHDVDLEKIDELRQRLDSLAEESPNNPLPIFYKAGEMS